MTTLTLSLKIFKANDIRGTYNKTLNKDIAKQIGMAFASEAKKQGANTIAVGRDGRLSSPALSEALIEGLLCCGITVIDAGLVPTPALYFTAAKHAAGTGIMITGSHNPKDDNGMKMMINNATLMSDDISCLHQRIVHQDFSITEKGTVKPIDIRDSFINGICDANKIDHPLTVVIDAGNGAAGEFAPLLLQALGCRVIPLFCEIDGNFPNHHPDPTQEKNLHAAANTLKETGADIALAFDGDGDRLGVILPDEPYPIFADRLLMLYAKDMLSRNPNATVVFDVKCTAQLKGWVQKHNGTPDMQPTGHAFIKSRMREIGALLGGEMSGHFFFKENWHGFDDALFAAARLVAILSKQNHAFTQIPNRPASPELHIAMQAHQDQHQIIDVLSKNLANHSLCDAQIITIDGLRIEYTNGFGLVRASNTTSSLVLRFEGDNENVIYSIKQQIKKMLLSVDDSIDTQILD